MMYDPQTAREMADALRYWGGVIRKAWELLTGSPGLYLAIFVSGLGIGAAVAVILRLLLQ